MNGHQELLNLRRRGAVPQGVWITDSDDHYSRVTAAEWDVRPDATTGALYGHIRIEAGDIPEALDLRCIQGLICHLSTDRGSKRFSRLFAAIADAGAKVVCGVNEGEALIFKKEETT